MRLDSAGVALRSTTCLMSFAPTGLYVTARNEAVQIDGLDLFRNEILQKSFKNHCNSKIFVYLPLIVRGDIRAVEGNLCLYPEIQNLENFEVDIRYEFASLICIQLVFLLKHMG